MTKVERLRTAWGKFSGYGWCARCGRSWNVADPGRGIAFRDAHPACRNCCHEIRMTNPDADYGSRRFALCERCEAEVGWAGRLYWDRLRFEGMERWDGEEWDRVAG